MSRRAAQRGAISSDESTVAPEPAISPHAPAVGSHSLEAPATASNAKVLARQVREAKRLTPALKRYWLAVLPHLQEADRRRLASILGSDAE